MGKKPSDFYELFIDEFLDRYVMQLRGKYVGVITAWPAFMMLVYQQVETFLNYNGSKTLALYELLPQFSYDAQNRIYNNVKSVIISGDWEASKLRATFDRITYGSVVDYLDEYGWLAFDEDSIFED